MKTLRKLSALFALVALAVAVPVLETGCQSVQITDSNKALAKAAVEVAVAEVVAHNPSQGPKIIAITEEIKKVAGTEGFNTVDLLISAIRLKANVAALTPEQQVLANLVLDLVSAKLKDAIPNGQINGANLVLIAELAGWVEEGATLGTVK